MDKEKIEVDPKKIVTTTIASSLEQQSCHLKRCNHVKEQFIKSLCMSKNDVKEFNKKIQNFYKTLKKDYSKKDFMTFNYDTDFRRASQYYNILNSVRELFKQKDKTIIKYVLLKLYADAYEIIKAGCKSREFHNYILEPDREIRNSINHSSFYISQDKIEFYNHETGKQIKIIQTPYEITWIKDFLKVIMSAELAYRFASFLAVHDLFCKSLHLELEKINYEKDSS